MYSMNKDNITTKALVSTIKEPISAIKEPISTIKEPISEEKRIENITNKLLTYQIPHFYQMIETIKRSNCILDASDTGTGKTYTTLALAKALKLKPLVICPKSVIPSWISVAKHFGIKLFGISNYELFKGCKYYTENYEKVDCPYMDKIIEKIPPKKNHVGVDEVNKDTAKSKKTFRFYLPTDTMIIFDEAHRCKNHGTITSQLLQGMIKTKCKIVLVSATISDKIPCFKPFGLAFGFYDNLKHFKVWMMRQIRARKIEFERLKRQGMFIDGDEQKLMIIHDKIFPQKGSRMKIAELGDMFPKNNIITQFYFCENYKEVQKEYDIINDCLKKLHEQWEQAELLGKIIRARQKIEMYKVPILMDLAEEALDGGYSVVMFVNYLDTMYNLADQLKADCLIHGGQSLEERTACISDFQNNKRKVIICIIQAGGVGISLHDIHGGHPRMSIMSPTWSGQDVKQALGRIHRAGSKTPAVQKLVYCDKTWEEHLAKIVTSKIKNIEAINDKSLDGGVFDTEQYTEMLDKVESVVKTDILGERPESFTSIKKLKKSNKNFNTKKIPKDIKVKKKQT